MLLSEAQFKRPPKLSRTPFASRPFKRTRRSSVLAGLKSKSKIVEELAADTFAQHYKPLSVQNILAFDPGSTKLAVCLVREGENGAPEITIVDCASDEAVQTLDIVAHAYEGRMRVSLNREARTLMNAQNASLSIAWKPACGGDVEAVSRLQEKLVQVFPQEDHRLSVSGFVRECIETILHKCLRITLDVIKLYNLQDLAIVFAIPVIWTSKAQSRFKQTANEVFSTETPPFASTDRTWNISVRSEAAAGIFATHAFLRPSTDLLFVDVGGSTIDLQASKRSPAGCKRVNRAEYDGPPIGRASVCENKRTDLLTTPGISFGVLDVIDDIKRRILEYSIMTLAVDEQSARWFVQHGESNHYIESIVKTFDDESLNVQEGQWHDLYSGKCIQESSGVL